MADRWIVHIIRKDTDGSQWQNLNCGQDDELIEELPELVRRLDPGQVFTITRPADNILERDNDNP